MAVYFFLISFCTSENIQINANISVMSRYRPMISACWCICRALTETGWRDVKSIQTCTPSVSEVGRFRDKVRVTCLRSYWDRLSQLHQLFECSRPVSHNSSLIMKYHKATITSMYKPCCPTHFNWPPVLLNILHVLLCEQSSAPCVYIKENLSKRATHSIWSSGQKWWDERSSIVSFRENAFLSRT